MTILSVFAKWMLGKRFLQERGQHTPILSQKSSSDGIITFLIGLCTCQSDIKPCQWSHRWDCAESRGAIAIMDLLFFCMKEAVDYTMAVLYSTASHTQQTLGLTYRTSTHTHCHPLKIHTLQINSISCLKKTGFAFFFKHWA